jgi:N6-L-threonylcarbamoyladenine synthase
VTEVLVEKTHNAAKTLGVKQIIVAGGVAANKGLRERLQQSITDFEVIIPSFKYCTDNAAMIGIAAYYQVNGKKPQLDYFIKGDSSLNFAGR